MAASCSDVLNINVGILGHVDSGKTSLSKALCEIESTASMDRHPQSVERGITLDLGFSAFFHDVPPHLEMDDRFSKVQYTLVDCPGHASLIRTIIGGASITDLVVLVVDAQKGFQTQTAEGLVIAEIATKRLVVALNKVDALPPETRDARVRRLRGHVRTLLAKTRFPDAPIVPVSARPGGGTVGPGEEARRPAEGIHALVDAIVRSTDAPQRDEEGPLLFAIDHCFALRGQGTVCTGTVLSGRVAVNDSVEFPALRLTRKVKSMQMFRRPVPHARQGDRVGLCFTQLDASLIERGFLASPGSLPPVTALLVEAHKVRFFKGEVASRTRFHVTVGHTTVMASAVFLSPEAPGAPGADSSSSSSSAPAPPSSSSTAPADALPGWHVGVGAADTPPYVLGADHWYARDLPQAPHLAVLTLDQPVHAPRGATVIGSRLDTDTQAQGNACRLAFFGRSLPYTLPDTAPSALPGPELLAALRICKPKAKTGTVERVQDAAAGTVIAKQFFGKHGSPEVFAGLTVTAATGQRGRIEGAFGKSGKVRVSFPPGDAPPPGTALALRFKKFLFADAPGTRGRTARIVQ